MTVMLEKTEDGPVGLFLNNRNVQKWFCQDYLKGNIFFCLNNIEREFLRGSKQVTAPFSEHFHVLSNCI